MRRLLPVLLVAVSTACIVEHDRVIPDGEPQAYAPPPPAADYGADQGSYQAEAPPAPPGSDISDESTFYNGLAPYGQWTLVAPYGRVWVPSVAYGWRPYYYGQWVLTDYGWTFASDDPWGWAAYHYGRWNWAGGVGWYWIPGNTWGPAWVSWRWGGGYAAWCPLGPDGVVFGYRHPAWVAVPEQHFTQPIRRVAVPMSMTPRVVGVAQPLSGAHAIARSGQFGPPVQSIQRAVGQPIARVPAAQVVGRAAQPRAQGVQPGQPAAGVMRSPAPRARADSAPRPYGSGGDARPAPRPYGSGGDARPAPRPYGGSPAPRPYGGGQAAPRGAQGAPNRGAPPVRSAPPPASNGSRGAAHPHAAEKSK